jgi:hypothetical protein
VVRSFSPQPTANDPGFAAFQSEVSAVSDEGNRIRAAFQATSPPGVSPTQLAQFLTVELREGVGLTERQQAAVYVLLRDELESGATPRAGRQALIADKAQLGEQIRAWLSPYQRRRFNFIYREDFLGLFTFVKIQ